MEPTFIGIDTDELIKIGFLPSCPTIIIIIFTSYESEVQTLHKPARILTLDWGTYK